MGLLRRKKEESNRSLLAPVPKSKRGLLGLRRSGPDGRSDNPLEQQTSLSSGAQWAKVKPPKTPPLTPPPAGQTRIASSRRAPVSNVTLVKGSSKNSKETSKGTIQIDAQSADDRSEYSDLTDNRTLQRIHEQKTAYEEAMKQKQQRDRMSSSATQSTGGSNPAADLKAKTKRTDPNQSMARNSPETPQKDFLSELFAYMDHACAPTTDKPKIENVMSFTPEWGVAPTFEDAKTPMQRPVPANQSSRQAMTPSPLPSRAMADALEDNTTVRTMKTNDDAFTDLETASPAITQSTVEKTPNNKPDIDLSSPRSVHHENFEMVLEELQEEEDEEEDSPTRKRNWMKNPFGRNKREDEEEEEEYLQEKVAAPPVISSKAHHDMVKKALFPDYDEKKSRPKKASEEEKKEEVADVAPAALTQDKTKRSCVSKKGLFSSLRRRNGRIKPKLEPVLEDKPSTPTEIQLGPNGVRPRAFVKPVRDNIVEDIYRDLEATGNSHLDSSYDDSNDMDYSTPKMVKKAPLQQSQPIEKVRSVPKQQPVEQEAPKGQPGPKERQNSAGFVGGFMAMISGATGQPDKPVVSQEVENMPENQKDIRKSKSNEQPKVKDPENQENVRRTSSAPPEESNKQPPNKKSKKKKKQVWKEVKDPNSSRIYYYHRETRETTWVRPKELDEPAVEDEPAAESQPPKEESADAKDLPRQQSSNSKSLRSSSSTNNDSLVLQQRQEITSILQSIAPPDGESIESLLAQYEGREAALLAHVKKLKESRPFDEPLAAEEEVECGAEEDFECEDEKHDQVHDLNQSIRTTGDSSSFPASGDSSRNSSILHSRSGVSKLSESTQQIANTRNRTRAYESVGGGTTLSSHTGSMPRKQTAQDLYRIPSKIPAPPVRDRDLMVEEFSQDRFKSETFNNDSRSSVGSQGSNPMRRRPFTTPSPTCDAPPTTSPDTIEEESNDHDELSSHANDTVSALSVNELEFVAAAPSQVPMDAARRRALDDAIRREDWDMAAAISEGMRNLKTKQESSRPRNDPGEWKQSEIDKFISDNDWEAVSEYIAHFRSKQILRDGARSPTESDLTGPNPTGRYSNNISKGKSRESFRASSRQRGGDPAYDEDSEDSGSDDYSKERRGRGRRPSSRGRASSRSRASSKGRSSNSRQPKVIPIVRSYSSSESTSDDDDYTDEYSSESTNSAFEVRRPRIPARRRRRSLR